MTSLAFVDTETTGLDPDDHEIWEVGLIVDDQEYLWQLPVDLGNADSMALKIGGFHNRRWGPVEVARRVGDPERTEVWQGRGSPSDGRQTSLETFASQFARLTIGAHLVGAVISFDEERLRRLLRRHHECPMWHYHLVDSEALVAGLHGVAPPWDSSELSRLVGVDPDAFHRHTALGDARWAKAMFDAVMEATR